MSRLNILGHFEWGVNYFWDVVGFGSVSATAHTGAYSWNVWGTTPSRKNLPAAMSDGYVAFWFRTNGLTSRRVMSWWVAETATELGHLYFNGAAGHLELYSGPISGSTLRASGTVPIQANTWYHIQVRPHIDNAAGHLTMRIDGTEDGTFTGDTQPGAETTYNQLTFHGDTATDSLYDDLVVNDTAGGVDDSWPGDVRLTVIRPNAAGSHDDLTGFGAANNWDCLDEAPVDGDTTYVYSSTVDQYALYNMTACGLTDVTILGVTPEAIARETVADAGMLAMMMKSGGTTVTDSDVNLLVSYWLVPGSRRKTDPDTGAAWTTGGIDALECGIKIR